MGRPRSKARKNWPDYLVARKRPKGMYLCWKHPETGKEYSLGYDFAEACIQAREANLILAKADTTKRTLADKIEGKDSVHISDWLDQFLVILAKRPSKKKGGSGRAASTIRSDTRRVDDLKAHFGDAMVDKITTKKCAELIIKLQNEGKEATAYLYRAFMVDCFSEAESAGLIPRGTNPAEITKAAKPTTKRCRLTYDQFKKVEDALIGPMKTAVNLALITGQRVGDISNMMYSDVENDYLKVQQEKTGARIKIPLDLSLNGISIRDVIKQSRIVVGAKHIVHQTKTTSGGKAGDKYKKESISSMFSTKLIEVLGSKWDGLPPTFHEIRALSKSLHKKNGVDTLALLGHDNEGTAKIYEDPRAGWTEISIGKVA